MLDREEAGMIPEAVKEYINLACELYEAPEGMKNAICTAVEISFDLGKHRGRTEVLRNVLGNTDKVVA